VNQRLGDRRGLEETLIALSEVFLTAGAAEEAAQTIEQVHKLPGSGESRDAIVRTRLVQADLALGDEDPRAAAAAATDAIELAKTSSMLAGEIQGTARLALAEARLEHEEEARLALKQLEELFEQAGQVERADRVHLLSAQAFEALGDTSAAARCYARAKAEIEARRGRMKSKSLRKKYNSQPRVVAIEEGCRRTATEAKP
jgi:hypothetical protein